jgi:hypothetical protein
MIEGRRLTFALYVVLVQTLLTALVVNAKRIVNLLSIAWT